MPFLDPKTTWNMKGFLPKRYGIYDITIYNLKKWGYGFPWNNIKQTKQEPFQISQKMKFSFHILNSQLYPKPGQMVTGVLMNYQPKTMRQHPPPTHTHTLFQGFVPWVSSRVLLWIDSNLSICKSPKVPFAHTSPPTKWVPFFMNFWLIPMWLFHLSLPDFGIVHTTGHYPRRCLVLLATSTNPHVAWLGVHLQD